MRSFFVLMDTAPPYIYPNDPTLPRTAAFPICRIGKPGAAPFSITGQPNAMGGREVGGLASTLASHMDFAPESVDRVRRFWSAPAMRSEEHTSELQSLMRSPYAVFCLKKKKTLSNNKNENHTRYHNSMIS